MTTHTHQRAPGGTARAGETSLEHLQRGDESRSSSELLGWRLPMAAGLVTFALAGARRLTGGWAFLLAVMLGPAI